MSPDTSRQETSKGEALGQEPGRSVWCTVSKGGFSGEQEVRAGGEGGPRGLVGR